MAQLLVHTAAQASSTFTTPPPHFTGDREPCVQRTGPSSTDCQSRLGPSSPKMVRQVFFLSAEELQAGLSGRDSAGGRLWVASQIRLCSLLLAAPPGKSFRPELFMELWGESLVIKLSGYCLNSPSIFKNSQDMINFEGGSLLVPFVSWVSMYEMIFLLGKSMASWCASHCF